MLGADQQYCWLAMRDSQQEQRSLVLWSTSFAELSSTLTALEVVVQIRIDGRNAEAPHRTQCEQDQVVVVVEYTTKVAT